MLFVIDVGNSHTVTGLYDGDRLVGTWRLKSERAGTDDELAILYHSLFRMEGIERDQVSGVAIASVVPTLEAAWISCCKKHFGRFLHKPLMVVSDCEVRDLITISLPNPKEVGADRLVNSIAAYQQFHCPLVVIDFGTAITFDCIRDGCEYLGGTILPGIAISLEALSSRTAKLPHIDVSTPPPAIIGKTTVDAMKSGILNGYGAMVDGMVKGIRRELTGEADTKMKVVATGGMAGLISPYTREIDHIDPLLTLTGLKIIYEHTRS